MALSGAEKASVFECLRGYWAGATASITNGYGITLSISDLATLTNDINTRLTAIDSDATALAKVQALVVKWDRIANSSVSIDGSVGDMTGVKYSAADARERLREQMHVYVPVMHMLEAIKARNAQSVGSSGASFGISR